MNIETLELIHKLLTEHVDNASRCCDRAPWKNAKSALHAAGKSPLQRRFPHV